MHQLKPQQYLLENAETEVPSFMMKPDITIKKERRNIAIFDAKWKLLNPDDKKRGVSQNDLYQLYTYASEYNLENVALIYPKCWEEQKEVEEFTFRTCGKKVFVISVSLDCINRISEFRDNLKSQLKSVLVNCI